MERRIGVKVLKAKLSEYVDRVRQGERFTVTLRGEDVAELVPVDPVARFFQRLVREGKASWGGGQKPAGLEGVRISGRPISETVLEDRR